MKEFFLSLNDAVHSLIWGPAMLCLLLGIGVYYTLRTGFFQLRFWKTIWRCTVGGLLRKKVPSQAKGQVSSFQAAATSLAGCIGTGNIVGVATALSSGGPGALFWMWVSSFFGMILKYAEILLGVHFKKKNAEGQIVGGPMYYLSVGLRQKWLGGIFAFSCILASFGIGNMTQVNSITQSFSDMGNAGRLLIGVLVATLVGLVVWGGISRIAKISAVTVPFFAFFYLAGTILILVFRANEIPHAFTSIFTDAFRFESAGGGILGYLTMNAVRFGFSRGVFSNEAGMGSASIAHAAADSSNEVEEGMWGIFEVFFDTLLMCTITGLVILTTGVLETGLDGAQLTAAAFSSVFGSSFSGYFLTISISMFAFATLIGWYYYGESCVKYLFSHRPNMLLWYRFLYLSCTVLGAVMELQVVWKISDTFNGFMVLPNLIGLIFLSGIVVRKTKEYECLYKKNKKVLK
ncbi:alanine/glycine:cation symporter family protein [Massiliimalia timonensis]|uniref:alanine/glycine:cation symporter family protein n=1 Tax=Massiliimalia timonensis TaxID=1987501 RepID=UPI000B8A7739|nr:sodium:alanine symporter family protein [Massiliimalia timonensis]